MTVARENLIDIQSTPYYHVINRCVRRAFLCGKDPYSGKNYEHRRQWIVDKIKSLSDVFAIDICAYAVLSNHYHLVLHINEAQAQSWDTKTVIEHWYELFKGNFLVDKYRSGEVLSQAELNVVSDCANVWQKRLKDISWYMRCLNEAIAREANKEDGCRGRFWGGRFKSQALLDETALLTCMMYVDLNPIRAGMTETLDSSDFTSIQERIFAVAKNLKKAKQQIAKQKKQSKTIKPKGTNLFPFLGAEREGDTVGIAYSLVDYFSLVDWTGRAVRDDKKAAIPAHIKPLLHKLNINEEEWLHGITDFNQCFGCALGSQSALKQYSASLEKNWLHGVKASQRFYRAA
jgi:REP element-mobilizing transposase RayT